MQPEADLLCHRVITHSEQVHVLDDILEELQNEGHSQCWRIDRFDEFYLFEDTFRRVPITVGSCLVTYGCVCTLICMQACMKAPAHPRA